jgi:xylulokinase
MFIGLRMDTTRADMVQAVLEGVAFAIRDSVEIARKQGVPIALSTLCGGGAKSPLWQTILCNVLNVEIAIPKTEQGPGYGAAMLAMVTAGEWENVATCAENLVEIKSTVIPQNDLVDRYEERYQKFKEIYPTVKELYKKLRRGNRL